MARIKRKPTNSGKDKFDNLLIFPAENDYGQHKGRVFSYKALIALGLILVLLILWVQTRMPEDMAIFNPFILFAIYAFIIYALNRSAVRAMPISIFYSKGNRSLVIVHQTLFSKSESQTPVSDIESIELVPVGIGPSGEVWKILIMTGESVLCELPPSERLSSKQSAARLAGAAMVPVIIRNESGAEVPVDSLDDLAEPLLARLGRVEPPQYNKKLHIDREKTNRGIRWNIGFPTWIPVSLFIFSVLNIFVGLAIWFVADTGSFKFASVFFFINSFIIISIAGSVKSYTRILEMTGEKIRLKDAAISVEGIEEIRAVPGVMPSIDFISQDGVLSLVVTGGQADWLKSDVESELWLRYGKNRK